MAQESVTKLPPPAVLHSADLAEFQTLSEARKKLIECALAEELTSSWLPYTAGGGDPDDGGFDCSGAIYYVLHKAGLEPPRSSNGQCDWLKSNHRFHEIPVIVIDLKDSSLTALKPGDLLFWAKPDKTPDGIIYMRVHHVAMYLGTEKKDGRPVMINATDGRSYRGKAANGYGVYDFRLPKADSPSKLVGYGTPPGIAAE